jgi:sterol desaturase/sphingolipid hydroxylase (fatty acid hydroxylase superfamily)
MTIFLTVWAVYIHDNISFTSNNIILHADHHTIHHDIGRTKNYGQFFTFWDKLGFIYSFNFFKGGISFFFLS